MKKRRNNEEDKLQALTCELLDIYGWLCWHTPNENSHHLARLGVKAGVPDWLIFEPTTSGFGLAIELKIKPNKVTAEQKRVMQQLELRGWMTAVCYTLDEFYAAIRVVRPLNGRQMP